MTPSDIILIWIAGVLLNLLLLKITARRDKDFEVSGLMLLEVSLLSFLFLVIGIAIKISENTQDIKWRDL